MPPILVSRFANKTDNRPEPYALDWPARFSQFDVRADKDGPLWSPARYAAGASRGLAGVAEVVALVLDFDDGFPVESALAILKPLGFEFCLHTSFSHRPDHHKFRVVIPFEAPIDAELYGKVWTKWVETFERHVDLKCKDPSRIWYLPAHPPGVEPTSLYVPGKRLDAGLDVAGWIPPAAPPGKRRDDASDVRTDLPPDVEAHYLREIVKLLAAHVPGHGAGRTDCFLAVSGALLKAGYPKPWIVRVIDRVCEAQGIDPDPEDRKAYYHGLDGQVARMGDPTKPIAGVSGLPRDVAPDVEALLTWRTLFGPYVPVGNNGSSLVFHNGQIAYLPIQQSNHETRLGVVFGSCWANAKKRLGLCYSTRKDADGNEELVPRVDEQKARREVAALLGLVCHRTIPEDRLADGVHRVGSTTVAVASGGTYEWARGQWHRLPIPLVDGVVCQPSGKVRGAPSAHSLDEVRSAYHRLCDLFARWTFEAQDYTVKLLAGSVLAIPLMGSLPAMAPWFWIQGRTNSGKSQLCRAFEALSAHVEEVGNATAYALMATLGNRSAAAIVDDVEGNVRALKTRDALFDQYRTGLMVRGNGGRTPSGLDRARLFGPLIYAGISGPDQDQDLNRFHQIRLAHRPGHSDPMARLGPTFAELRPIVSWGLACHADAYLALYDSTAEIAEEQGVPPRAARNVIPAAMLAILLGEDFLDLFDEASLGVCRDLAEHGSLEVRFLDYLLDLPIAEDQRTVTMRERIAEGQSRLPAMIGSWNGQELVLNATAIKTALPGRSEYADWTVKRVSEVLRAHPWFSRTDLHSSGGRRRCLYLVPPPGTLTLSTLHDPPPEKGRESLFG